MSDSDSFIDEVTEEVRRDRLFRTMKRYGWIAVLAVLVIVGGAAWNEWSKARDRARAEAFGDAMLNAMEAPDRTERAEALTEVEVPQPAARAVRDLLAAAEASATAPEEAAERLLALAEDQEIDPVYRQIALLKAVSMSDAGLSADTRRGHLEGLALGGGVMRLLAEEQLAMIEIEEGETDAALERLQQILTDAGATSGLRSRAAQAIVALGGDLPETQADAVE